MNKEKIQEQWNNLSEPSKKIKPLFGVETWQQFHEWRQEHNLPDDDEANVYLFLCCGGRPLPVLQKIREIGAKPTEIARIVSEAHILELFIYRDYLKFKDSDQPHVTELVTDKKGNWYERTIKKVYPPWETAQAEDFIKWAKERRLRLPSKDSELHKAQTFSGLIYELVEYFNPFFLTRIDKLKYQGDKTPVKEEVFSLIGQILEQYFPEWFSNSNPSQLKSRYYNELNR